jgi:hypothetical protein
MKASAGAIHHKGPKELRFGERRKIMRRLLLIMVALVLLLALMPKSGIAEMGGATTANGWYEGEEIYYIDQGIEEGVVEQGQNDIYLIGGDRLYQAQVVEFIPGEAGYSPHWNVNVVHTAPGVTVSDILNSEFASERFAEEGVLFDDVEDILGARDAGLVTIEHPGLVVLCPIISEEGAEAPGNMQLPEEFPPFPETF